jgi:hypothetical protein
MRLHPNGQELVMMGIEDIASSRLYRDRGDSRDLGVMARSRPPVLFEHAGR